jgi:hypothetical protein
MAQHFVDQGLVTARDQSLLKPGELSRADDSYYKPGDPGIWVVPGRTLYNSTPEAGTIVGVRFLGFDTVADIIVVAVGTAYRRGPATATGAFVDLVTGLTGGPSLDSIYYNGAHTLLNGVDRGQVVVSTYDARPLGMLRNSTPVTINETGGVGPGFNLAIGLFVAYWIEERVKDANGNIVRRSALGFIGATSIYATNGISGDGVTLYKPRITRPALVNSGGLLPTETLHWALFATAGTTANTFPIGAELGEAVAATTFIDDTRTGNPPAFPGGPIYETMSVQIAGTYLVVPRNYPPPIASTGDALEESFVLNDVSDLSLIRYSWSETIDAYPPLNYIKFSEKEQDEVRVIRTVGASTVVLLRDTAWRIDYLPRPEDSEFNRGRCRSIIPGAPGVVNNPNAAAVFSMGDKYFLAYISPAGLCITDGFSQTVLSEDLDWPNTVNLSALDKATLIDNKDKFQLEVRYPAVGSSVNNKILLVQYHQSHLKQGATGARGKVTGPIARPSTAATDALISDQNGVYSAQGVSLYVEWAGTTDPATGVPIAMIVQSGDLYLAGYGKQGEVKRMWVHHNAGGGGATITATITTKNEGQADVVHSQSISGVNREATSWEFRNLAEAFVYGAAITAPTTAQKINYFILEGEEQGDAKN